MKSYSMFAAIFKTFGNKAIDECLSKLTQGTRPWNVDCGDFLSPLPNNITGKGNRPLNYNPSFRAE